jgi:hypothetical protein
MYTLIREIPLKSLLAEHVPSLAISLVIAELFFKFKSFTLECLAFLATWFCVDAAIRFLINIKKKGIK